MKNIFNVLVLSCAILVGNAQAKTAAIITGNDTTPFTVHASGKFDMGAYHLTKTDHGMGAKSLSGNIGLSHYIGHDFEYGVSILAGWSTPLMNKLFAGSGKKDGFKVGGNINARFMPQITEAIRVGGLVNVGYSRLSGDGNKNVRESFSFGDMNFDVGPAFMHQAHPIFAWGFGITYGMSEMRFGKEKAPPALKKYSNLHTVRLPIDLVVQATENIGAAVAFEPAWRHLEGHEFHHGFFYDVSLGVNILF